MPNQERKRLDSWGEIAKYLNRDLTTVKRWEKEKLLPVHRLPGGKRQAVFAYQDELDKWLSGEDKAISADKEHKYFGKTGLITAGVVIVAVTVFVSNVTSSFSPKVVRQQRLTHDRLDKSVRLFTDGPHVYFGEFVGEKNSIAVVPSAGGEVVHIPVPFQDFSVLDVAADGSAFFVVANPNGPDTSFWRMPLPGGSLRPIENLGGTVTTWSADERYVAYRADSDGRSLYVANGDGTASRQIFTTTSGRIECPRWSPSGRLLRFAVTAESQHSSLWEVQRDGSDAHVMLPDASLSGALCGSWASDGKYFVFDSFQDDRVDLWAMSEQRGWVLPASHKALRLTNGALEFLAPTISTDGKRIFALGIEHDAELVRYDVNSQAFVPYLGGISAGHADFSRDAKWVTYVKHPEQTLWRRRVDGGDELQLTFAPLRANGPHWSPDGKQIAFRASLPGQPYKVFTIARNGGLPQEVQPEEKEEEGIPTWSRDGKSLVFGELRWHPDKIAIHILNLKSKQVSMVPGSQGLWSPRWSPDGRYLLALEADALSSNSKSMSIFDFKTSHWKRIVEHRINEPVWSHDGRYIYFDVAAGKHSAIFRVRLSDGKLERITSLENFHRAGQILGDWFGLAPDDSPLLLRDRRNTEVYALDVEW